jgi:hypothetical protein
VQEVSAVNVLKGKEVGTSNEVVADVIISVIIAVRVIFYN